jgi:hypothetical protein
MFGEIIVGSALPPEMDDSALSHSVFVAKKALEMRRNRDRIFGSPLFLDAAWDIMLISLLNEYYNRSTCLSEIVNELPISKSTVERWLVVLESELLIDATNVADSERCWNLTNLAMDKLQETLKM